MASCNENKYKFLTVFSIKHFYKFSDVGSFVHLQEYKAGKRSEFIISKTPRFINAESQHKSEHFTYYSGKVTKPQQNTTTRM